MLRLRHAITNTNYYVQVFAARGMRDRAMIRSVPVNQEALEWIRTNRLAAQPLTGLARKVLQRLDVMELRKIRVEGEDGLEPATE
jgi:A/G-specific adenine glycosylase